MDKRILLNYGDFQLDKMVFAKHPKSSHLERLQNPTPAKLIHAKAEDAPVEVPASNSSHQTLHELQQMALDIKSIGAEKQAELVKKDDSDFNWRFEKICKKNDLRWNKKFIDQLMDEAGDIILNIKYKWNRPRPFQLAPKLGVDLMVGKAYTAESPSFPSGHSAQSQLLADVLSSVYPLHRDAFQALPEKISYSRYIGGLHFKSDIDYGKRIGSWLADHTDVSTY